VGILPARATGGRCINSGDRGNKDFVAAKADEREALHAAAVVDMADDVERGLETQEYLVLRTTTSKTSGIWKSERPSVLCQSSAMSRDRRTMLSQRMQWMSLAGARRTCA
jgi:hypothetical protein